ncbi:hypothetical protein GCM10020358_64200 [Amorphoplanes nipponensis]|uniref:Uncharacterized protein n=1 Tax=Actinoplanes nipponensis TaxID=135950 RepID=A0A919MWF6_9ACTN|nr:hypothetical protein [Actinoplanes nipponensis]GIE52175.1 hypothetical protein Ani05nite_57090 [Actinoplanes nipponensis]
MSVRLLHWPFRLSMSVAALMLLDQSVFAGQFLSGSFTALHTHRENATYAGIAVLVAAASAVLLRWPGPPAGRGPVWPLLACLALFGLIALQIVLGFARTLTVHVPLGVLIILMAVRLAVWAWRYQPAPVRPAPGPLPVGTPVPDAPVAAAPEARP